MNQSPMMIPTDDRPAYSAKDEEEARRLITDSGKYDHGEVDRLIREWRDGKPLAYITGIHEFGTLSLTIRPPIYIPRVETEQWVLLLLSQILSSLPPSDVDGKKKIRILDICSGSGCIPLLLSHASHGQIESVGLEIDPEALTLAGENTLRNGLEGVSRFEKFDLFQDDPIELKSRVGSFDMVISNPPYVSSSDMKSIGKSWYEGKYALQGKLKGTKNPNVAINLDTFDDGEEEEDDGLSAFRRIREIYHLFLKSDQDRVKGVPKLVLEIGAKQAGAVKEMFKGQGRMTVTKETERRKSLGAPQLEKGSMVGTERSLWIYDEAEE